MKTPRVVALPFIYYGVEYIILSNQKKEGKITVILYLPYFQARYSIPGLGPYQNPDFIQNITLIVTVQASELIDDKLCFRIPTSRTRTW